MMGHAKKSGKEKTIPIVKDAEKQQYLVKVKVGDHSTHLIVDTASYDSFVTLSFLKSCGLEGEIKYGKHTDSEYLYIRSKIYGTIDTAFEYGDEGQRIRFRYLVNDFQCFLGRDFLEGFNCRLDLGSNPSLMVRNKRKNYDPRSRHIYAQVSVKDKKHYALLDTGCTANYISTETAKEMGLNLSPFVFTLNFKELSDGQRTTEAIELSMGSKGKVTVSGFFSCSDILGIKFGYKALENTMWDFETRQITFHYQQNGAFTVEFYRHHRKITRCPQSIR